MAWIEVHQDFENHPKILMLKKLSGLPGDTVLGRVLKLWLWSMAYAPDGDLRRYEPLMVEEACGLPIEMLIKVGFVDKRPYLRVHDWWDYAGRFLKIKYKNYEDKWRRIEKSYVRKLGNPKNTLRTLTNQPNQPNQPTTSDKIDEWFSKIWERYPSARRHGKEAAFKRFSKSIKDFEDALRCARALDKYLKSLSDEKYLLRASRWFNEWEDYADERRDSAGVGSSMAEAGAAPGVSGNGIAPAVREVVGSLGNSMPASNSKDRVLP